jgi:hypothetical protein
MGPSTAGRGWQHSWLLAEVMEVIDMDFGRAVDAAGQGETDLSQH